MRRVLYAASSLAIVAASPAWSQASASPYTTSYRIDEMGRVTGTITPDPDTMGSGNPHQAVRNTYDAAGRLTRVETGTLANWQAENVRPKDWVGFERVKVVDITYDLLSRKLTETVKDGSLVSVALTQYSYDGYGRLECTAVRMNPAEYRSLPTSACLPDTEGSFGPDRITRNHYDAAGRLVKVQKAVGTLDQIDYARYEYTANSKQRALIDANNNRAEMTWDGHDRQARWIFPSKTTVGAVDVNDYEEYNYDANGNRTSLKKRDGQTIGYGYDALNRVTVKDLPGTTTDDVYYAYDLRGLQLSARSGSSSGQGVINQYDGFGRLTKSTVPYRGALPGTLEYVWDANGNRTSIKHPDGVLFTYHYDGLDRLTAIKENGTTEVVSLSYDAQGRRVGSTRAGVATSYGYDGISRLTSLTDNLASSPNDVALTFGYNPASQIVTRERDNDLYRFTGYVNVDRPYATNGLNQYTTAGAVAFCHDRNGNLTQDGTLAANGSLVPGTGSSYKYDVENRLLERRARVSSSCENIDYSGAVQASLSYDQLGRLRKTWDGSTAIVNGVNTTNFWLYDGDELVLEYNSVGDVLRRYVHGPGEDDPMLWYEGSTVSAATRRSIQTDHQGSVVSIADSSGAMIAINAYDEYGIPKPGNVGRFQYTGQAWIPELGMYHYKARIYSPTLGRFLQVDPIGYNDQVNLYTYVSNDPVNMRDPTGLYECLGSKTQCRLAEKFYNALSAAASSRRISEVARGVLKSNLESIGAPGVANGVTVKFGDLKGEATGSFEATGGLDKGVLTLDIAKIVEVGSVLARANGVSLGRGILAAGAETLGHESGHSWFGETGGKLGLVIATEKYAYTSGNLVLQAMGIGSNSGWTPGISGEELEKRIRAGAIRSCIAARTSKGGQFGARLCESAVQ